FWKRIKNQNGYRCTSLNRSKRVSTQIKCLADKLATLSELSLHRPDIYPDAKCTTCSTRQDETQDHLEICTIYKWQWYNIIDITLSVAWSKLTREDRLNLTKEDLKILVCGTTCEEELHLRTNIIKGLFTQKATDDITNKLGLRKKASQIIETFSCIGWNSFFNFIWKPRCESYKAWERREEIT
ncbi:2397_t:CDS:1, partial [Gigaspora rosea]